MSPRRKLLTLAVVLTVVAAGGIAAILVGGERSRTKSTRLVGPEGGRISAFGATVVVPRGALRERARISIELGAPSHDDLLPGTIDASRTFRITLSKPLVKPVDLHLPVSRGPRASARVFAASRAKPSQMWALSRARFDRRRSEIVVQTLSLSWWKSVKELAKEVAHKASKAALDAGTTAISTFLRVGGTRASEPSCGQPPTGYSLSGDVGIGDANALIFACLEQDGSDMALHIVNNRAIGMEFDLPRGLRVSSRKSSSISDEILNLADQASGSGLPKTIPATGEVKLTGSPQDESLTIKPTTRAFVFDLMLFAVSQTGGKAESVADFINCAGNAAVRIRSGAVSSAGEALDAALGVWGDCGKTLVKAGATATAEAGAVFFGGMKLGVGLTDTVAALIKHEEAHLEIKGIKQPPQPQSPEQPSAPSEPANGPCGTVQVTTPKYGYRVSAVVTVEGFVRGGPSCEEAQTVIHDQLLGQNNSAWRCRATSPLVICMIPGQAGHIQAEVRQDG